MYVSRDRTLHYSSLKKERKLYWKVKINMSTAFVCPFCEKHNLMKTKPSLCQIRCLCFKNTVYWLMQKWPYFASSWSMNWRKFTLIKSPLKLKYKCDESDVDRRKRRKLKRFFFAADVLLSNLSTYCMFICIHSAKHMNMNVCRKNLLKYLQQFSSGFLYCNHDSIILWNVNNILVDIGSTAWRMWVFKDQLRLSINAKYLVIPSLFVFCYKTYNTFHTMCE